MTTRAWDLAVREDVGRVILMLKRGDVPVATASVSWPEYQSLVTSLARHVHDVCVETLKEHLGPRIWGDALTACGGDSDRAMRLLSDLKWTQDTNDRYASGLSELILDALLKRLPEVR